MNPALHCVRSMIDIVDTGMVGLLALRSRLAHTAGFAKRLQGLPALDSRREACVKADILDLATRLGVSPAAASDLAKLLISDGRRAQELGPDADLMTPPAFTLALVPYRIQRMTANAAMAALLRAPLANGELDFLSGRHLGIEVRDLGARWVITLESGQLRTCESDATAEATVRGGLRDLLSLATRQVDADTLFFQRRLQLTGDTELGLTARNLLERVPWETVPFVVRIAAERAASRAQR